MAVVKDVRKSSSFIYNFKMYLFIYLAVPSLSCGTQDLSGVLWDLFPWPGIEPEPPVLGAWSLSHWTTREIPRSHLKGGKWCLQKDWIGNDEGHACMWPMVAELSVGNRTWDLSSHSFLALTLLLALNIAFKPSAILTMAGAQVKERWVRSWLW